VAILGCLINRRTNKVKVEKTRIFKPAAWIALVLLGISVLYLFVSVFADVGLSINYAIKGDYNDPVNPNEKEIKLLQTTLSASMLLVYASVIFIPSWISQKRLAHKN
jgi:hypothetical protein